MISFNILLVYIFEYLNDFIKTSSNRKVLKATQITTPNWIALKKGFMNSMKGLNRIF